MQKRTTPRKGFTYATDNKLRGAFGDTDLQKRKIRINKKAIRQAKKTNKWQWPKKDSSIINILVHETLHSKHPKMHEKTVRKLARRKVKTMSKSSKKKLYNKVT